jgi:hypothetical protein
MSGRIDHGIPTPALKFVQLKMSITFDTLDRAETFSRIIPTIKDCYLMPTLLRRNDDMSPQESRPTEDE